MIINQGLQEGLISSAPRSVTQPHQYISLSSPINIYQYINTWEEAIHDVAPFLCTRSAIACNNQIRCFVKNHPRCIQSRSEKLRNLKSEDPVVSILLSCSFSASRVSISGWYTLYTFVKLITVKVFSLRCYPLFFGGGKAKTDDGLLSWLHDCVWILLYICIKKYSVTQVLNPFPYCISNLWQLMTRAVLMKVSRKVLLWGADPLFT